MKTRRGISKSEALSIAKYLRGVGERCRILKLSKGDAGYGVFIRKK